MKGRRRRIRAFPLIQMDITILNRNRGGYAMQPETRYAKSGDVISVFRVDGMAVFSLCWICDLTFVSNRHGGCDG